MPLREISRNAATSRSAACQLPLHAKCPFAKFAKLRAYLRLLRVEVPELDPPAATPLPGRSGGRTTGSWGPFVSRRGDSGSTLERLPPRSRVGSTTPAVTSVSATAAPGAVSLSSVSLSPSLSSLSAAAFALRRIVSPFQAFLRLPHPNYATLRQTLQLFLGDVVQTIVLTAVNAARHR